MKCVLKELQWLLFALSRSSGVHDLALGSNRSKNGRTETMSIFREFLWGAGFRNLALGVLHSDPASSVYCISIYEFER